MLRVAIIAGIAQAVPEINGTTLLPDSPKFRIILSIKKTTRLMYPLSSSMDMNKNKNAISLVHDIHFIIELGEFEQFVERSVARI